MLTAGHLSVGERFMGDLGCKRSSSRIYEEDYEGKRSENQYRAKILLSASYVNIDSRAADGFGTLLNTTRDIQLLQTLKTGLVFFTVCTSSIREMICMA